jgi:hypothetical protein
MYVFMFVLRFVSTCKVAPVPPAVTGSFPRLGKLTADFWPLTFSNPWKKELAAVPILGKDAAAR